MTFELSLLPHIKGTSHHFLWLYAEMYYIYLMILNPNACPPNPSQQELDACLSLDDCQQNRLDSRPNDSPGQGCFQEDKRP